MADVFTSLELWMFRGILGIPILVRDAVWHLMILIFIGRIPTPWKDTGLVRPKSCSSNSRTFLQVWARTVRCTSKSIRLLFLLRAMRLDGRDMLKQKKC